MLVAARVSMQGRYSKEQNETSLPLTCQRHPIIRTDVNKITDSFEYEDRGVNSHYGLQSIFWSAIGN